MQTAVAYLPDERQVVLVFSVGAVFILHLDCDNWATLGILCMN